MAVRSTINEISTVGFGIINLKNSDFFTQREITEPTGVCPIMVELTRNGETVDFELLHGPTGASSAELACRCWFQIHACISVLSRCLLCNDKLG